MDIAGELYDKYAENISYESSENERYRELRSKLKSISVEFEKQSSDCFFIWRW